MVFFYRLPVWGHGHKVLTCVSYLLFILNKKRVTSPLFLKLTTLAVIEPWLHGNVMLMKTVGDDKQWYWENLLPMILVTVVSDGSPSMTLLTVVIFGSPSITTSFTTGLVSMSLYSVITLSPFTTIVSTFGPVSITRVTGPRTRKQRFKKDYVISDLIHTNFTSYFYQCNLHQYTKESPGWMHDSVFWQS